MHWFLRQVQEKSKIAINHDKCPVEKKGKGGTAKRPLLYIPGIEKLKILFDLANDNRRGGENFERNSLRRHNGNGIEREDHGGEYQVGDGHEDYQHCCRVPAESE